MLVGPVKKMKHNGAHRLSARPRSKTSAADRPAISLFACERGSLRSPQQRQRTGQSRGGWKNPPKASSACSMPSSLSGAHLSNSHLVSRAEPAEFLSRENPPFWYRATRTRVMHQEASHGACKASHDFACRSTHHPCDRQRRVLVSILTLLLLLHASSHANILALWASAMRCTRSAYRTSTLSLSHDLLLGSSTCSKTPTNLFSRSASA